MSENTDASAMCVALTKDTPCKVDLPTPIETFKILQLPLELFESVLKSSLEDTPLKTLALVCRQFRHFARPRLLRSLQILEHDDIEKFFEWNHQESSFHRDTVRKIVFGPECTDCEEHQAKVAWCLQQLPNIEILRIPEFVGPDLQQGLGMSLMGLKHLVRLNIATYTEDVFSLPKLFLALPRSSSLRALSFSIPFGQVPFSLDSSLPKIEEIEIVADECEPTAVPIEKMILEHFSASLKYIHVVHLHRGAAAFSLDAVPNLYGLRVGGMGHLNLWSRRHPSIRMIWVLQDTLSWALDTYTTTCATPVETLICSHSSLPDTTVFIHNVLEAMQRMDRLKKIVLLTSAVGVARILASEDWGAVQRECKALRIEVDVMDSDSKVARRELCRIST